MVPAKTGTETAVVCSLVLSWGRMPPGVENWQQSDHEECSAELASFPDGKHSSTII